MNSEWTANEKHVVGEGGLVNFQVVRGFVVVVLVVDWCNENDVGGEAEEEVLAAGHFSTPSFSTSYSAHNYLKSFDMYSVQVEK